MENHIIVVTKSQISTTIYIGLEEDATTLSKLFDFKITKLNDIVQKAGFPAKKLDFYTNLLTNCSVDFEIVDLNYGKIENQEDYLNNQKVQEILKEIRNLDMNNVSYKEAFEILWKANVELKNLNKEEI